jgi:UDP-N-acetylglucosamine transferase subunit ALG13
MIFVTVGTNEAPFDRLLAAFEAGVGDEELLVQHGPSRIRPAGATCVEFLSYDELVEAVARARVVVMHAGVGSIMTALGNGKRPVVVPRLRRFGEAVDDHQLSLGRRLHESGLVTLVEDPGDVPAALGAVSTSAALDLGPSRRLVAELRELVAERRGRRKAATGPRSGRL